MNAHRVRWLLMVLLLASSVAAAWAVYTWRQFVEQPVPLSATEHVQVQRGTGVYAQLDALAQRFGQPAVHWRVLYRLRGNNRPVQAGEYRLEPGMAPADILEKLLRGQVVQHRFRIQEGWTWKQLQQAMRQETRLKMDLNEDGRARLREVLMPEHESLEGLFFPDTYRFQQGSSATDLLLRAGRLMQRHLQQGWDGRDPEQTAVLETPYQALILASIVEKETALVEEMPRIAGVFLNRLRKNMRLQTDPTVIYGLGDAYDGNIRRKDLKTPTPWNTYVIHGLPPTPICMPGAAAIQAVMQPEAHDLFYFVADGSGGHHFSRDYEEHWRAVRRYQLKKAP